MGAPTWPWLVVETSTSSSDLTESRGAPEPAPATRRSSDTTTRFGALALTTNPLCSKLLPLACSRPGSAGRSCSGKRDAFQKLFHGFDVAEVARMTSRDVESVSKWGRVFLIRRRIGKATRAWKRLAAAVLKAGP